MCQRISAAPPALSRLHRSLTAADLRRGTINDTARGVHGRSKPSMQQRPGRPRNETRAVHVVRAEHHDRECSPTTSASSASSSCTSTLVIVAPFVSGKSPAICCCSPSRVCCGRAFQRVRELPGEGGIQG